MCWRKNLIITSWSPIRSRGANVFFQPGSFEVRIFSASSGFGQSALFADCAQNITHMRQFLRRHVFDKTLEVNLFGIASKVALVRLISELLKHVGVNATNRLRSYLLFALASFIATHRAIYSRYRPRRQCNPLRLYTTRCSGDLPLYVSVVWRRAGIEGGKRLVDERERDRQAPPAQPPLPMPPPPCCATIHPGESCVAHALLGAWKFLHRHQFLLASSLVLQTFRKTHRFGWSKAAAIVFE